MYHYQPAVALEELEEDAVLPNPVHVRDMIIRARLSPDHALELNQIFQEYLHSFGETQAIGRRILEQLSTEPLKRHSAGH
jgi:hypothetical protein